MCNFQGLIKNEVEFPRVTKKNTAEFPRVLVYGPGISKSSDTIFGISRGGSLFYLEFKVKK